MRNIVSLVRSIINAILLLLGVIAVVVIAATLISYGSDPGDPRLIIETGPLQGRSPTGAEARGLYAVLQSRVDVIDSPVSNDPSSTLFSIAAGETAMRTAQRLQASGLISDSQLFGQLLRYNMIDTKLQAGQYQLRRNMTMKEIGAILYRGHSGQNVITVPPGWRMEQLAEYLNSAGVMNGSQFLVRARQGVVINHALLADRPAGQSYEGYLFPGTYLRPDNPTPEALIAQMLVNMADQLPSNSLDLARQRGLTFYQVLILASIVEREAALQKERPLIASVYLNRLSPENPQRYLQADPTVQYAMGYQRNSGQWWKTPVQLEEYELVDSPYNTYLYPGLPPGPIASPGLDSIVAVLQPADTNYLFFVCRYPGCKGGEHAFAESYEEHLQNVAAYWDQ